jgi:hypothetical protein
MHRPTAALALALLLAGAAPATTLSGETTADLVLAAESVCCGAVESVEARRDPRSGFVFTHVRVRLLEEMKGTGDGPVIELRLPGGKADGVETVAPGMPRFEVGAEAVLLLGRRNREGFRGLLQATGGVLPLKADKAGKRSLRVRATGFADLADAREVTLDSFRGAVGRLLREEADRVAAAARAAEPAAPGAPAAEPPPAETAPEAGERPSGGRPGDGR